jgi:hypothetical protein
MDVEAQKEKPGFQERIESLRTWTSHDELKLPFWFEHVVFVVFSLAMLLLIVFTQ